MSEKVAIVDMLNRAATAYDDDALQLLVDCYTEDAVFTQVVEGQEPLVLEGKEEIRGLYDGAKAAQTDVRRHVISNIHFTSESESAATVVSYLLLVSIENGDLQVLTSGRFTDDVVLDGSEWRFKKRYLKLDRGA